MSATHDIIRPSVVNLKRLRPGMKAAVTLGTPSGVRAFMVEYDHLVDSPIGDSAKADALMTELPYNSVVSLATVKAVVHTEITVGKQWNIGLSDEAYEVLGIEIR